MADAWLKPFSCTSDGEPAACESSTAALQAFPEGSQPAYCTEKLARVEVTVTSTESASLCAVWALAPAASNTAIKLAGSRVSAGPPEIAPACGATALAAGLALGAAL